MVRHIKKLAETVTILGNFRIIPCNQYIKTMTEKKQITITEDEFYEKYNPLPNLLRDDAPFGGFMFETFGGFMFETFGPELEFVEEHLNCDTCRRGIWTVIEAEGNFYFLSGFHYVNRFGYLLTEELVDENTEIEVKIDTEIDE